MGAEGAAVGRKLLIGAIIPLQAVPTPIGPSASLHIQSSKSQSMPT